MAFIESEVFRGSHEWPTNNVLVLDIILSSSMKLDESSIDMLQEENINDVCNEAFDGLLTQEFNFDQEDFEPDQDDYKDDMLKKVENFELGLFQYIFPLYLISLRLRYGIFEGIFSSCCVAALGFLLFICCV